MSRPPVSIFVRVPGMLGMCLLVAGFGVAPAVGYVHSAAAPTETSDPKDDEKESSDPKDGTTDPPAKEPKKDKDDQGKTEDKLRKTQIDPKLKEKLDELLDGQAVEPGQEAKKSKAGRAGRTRQDQPPKSRQPHRPAGQVPPRAKSLKPGEEPDAVDPESEQPDGSSTLLNIPPIDSDVPPEERTYIFSIKDGTYEQLVEGFARQTGLGVMGEAPKDGRVTFVSTEELSFEEALARVRMLLFNYKPHEPYWIERHETHLEVVRVNDILRVLPLDRMFKTLDDFRAANLRDDELALVIYTPKSGSVADLKVVRDFMPDYVRVAPLNGSSVTIFALVKDIKKYLQLKDILVRDTADPRTLERIEIKYILPTEAVDRLQELMDFDGGAGTSRPRSAGRAGRAKEITQLDTMPEPEVSLLPDNAQGILLVRAMQNKIEEIKRLLPYIDVDTSGQEHEPVVIPVEHADPAELISTVQQILGAFSTPRTSDGTKKPSSRRSRGSKAPTAPVVAADDITMLLHPSEAAIIVLADEEDIKRIRKLIEWLDKPGQVGPVKIPLEYADGTEIIATVTLVLEGGGGKGKGKTRPEQFQLMPDPGNEAVWFTGSERDLVKVRELVAILDVPEQAVSLHIIRLEHQKPSFVANILREYDGSAASSPAAASRKPRGKRGAKTVAASKFTPHDEQNRLFVLCTDSEWEEYVAIIEDLEGAVDDEPLFVRVAVEHIDPDAAIDQLSSLIGGPGGRETAVRYAPTEGGILVMGASEADLDDIKILLAEIDRPVLIEQRTFEIRYADPGEIKSAIETLVGDKGGPPSRRRPRPDAKGAASKVAATILPELTVVELGNHLIVRTTPEKMAEVAALIAEFDVEEVTTELRVYEDFAPGTDIAGLADTVSSAISGTPQPARMGKGGAKPGMSGAPRFIPQPRAGRLIVIAPPETFPEIERFLEVLRSEVELDPIVVAYIDVAFADPVELVEQITPLLDMQVDQMVETGELDQTGEDAGGPSKPGRRGRGAKTGDTSDRYHIAADTRNSRIVIAAPQGIIDEARKLVADFDKAGGDEEPIFRTVELLNADPTEMVGAIKEMRGAPPRRVSRRTSKKGAAPTTVSEPATLSIVEAPGGGAVVLHGPREDVEQATEWIEQLDAMSTPGRIIKVYEIVHADIGKLADLILNVVDTPPKQSPKQRSRPRKGAEPALEEDEFALSKTWTGQDVYIQADLVADTMIVAAPQAKIAQIDKLVAQFDTEEAVFKTAQVPCFTYELQYADAFDAEFELQAFLDQMWHPRDEVPKVESALWGDYLIVCYPHEDRFPEIEEIVRTHIDKLDEEDSKFVRRSFKPPAGLSAEKAALLLQLSHPDVKIVLKNLSPGEREEPLERVRPLKPANGNPCVLPLALTRMTDQVLASVVGQQEPDEEEPQHDPDDLPPPVEEEPVEDEPAEDELSEEELVDDEPTVEDAPLETSDDMLRATAMSLLESSPGEVQDSSTAGTKFGRLGGTGELPSGAELRIEYDDEKDVIVVEGPAGVVDKVENWVDELEEELKEFRVPPDIRIYRVKYIDVHAAANILEEMFNATRQQRQTVAAAQRQQQQALRQQQQRRQQPQKGQQEQGQQPGQPQRPGQQGRQQQQQVNVPQLPPTAVRVYPNPRDRTLILRADTSQYPAIIDLLATIDQPQPIDSEMRTFKLEKLNATEVEEVLKDILGLDQQPSARASTPQRGRGGARTPSQSGATTRARLPRTIMQETTTGSGMLGIDPSDIKLWSNEAANTIVAMAPKVALDLIGDLIEQLESGEISERVTKYYELKHAQVEEVADYLASHFEEESGPRKVGKRAKAGAAPAKGGSLNTPSFVPYPRLNLLTVLATAEQIEEIDGLIERLDVSSEQDQWEHVTLKHADANVVADTLSQMFGGGRAGTSHRALKGQGRSTPSTGAVAKFIGEEAGRMLIFSAPQSLREQIFETIDKLEVEASVKTTVRVVELEHATPSKVAEAIEAAYGGGTRGGRGRKGAATGTTRFSITSHDPTKRLFVVADDEMFAEIESLASTLDRSDIGFEFRIYPLQYADAKQVHALMTKLMTDYMRLLGRNANVEPFSVEVDEKTNSLIALGGPVVFGFLEENLAKIDNPANAASPPGFLMIVLKNANAQEVAQNINRLWRDNTRGRGSTTTEQPPQAEANRAMNMLIVRGTQEQIDEIQKEFIDPLEEQTLPQLLTETFRLEFAQPEAVAESINRFFEDKKRAFSALRERNISPIEFTVAVTPDVNTKQIIVQASKENMALVKARIAELDREDVAVTSATTMEIYPLKYADPNAVVNIITQWARARTQSAGRSRSVAARDVVNAVAESATQSVVVTASQANHLIVQELIDGLDDETLATHQRKRHILKLEYLSAAEVANQFTQVFRGARRVRGDPGPAFIADPKTNSIVANLNDEELTEVNELLAILDVELSLETERITEVYPLRYADPGSVNAVVLNMFRWDRRSQPSPSEQVTSAVEGATQSVIVTASAKNHVVIEAFIEKVDVESNFAKELHTYKLENANAEDVAKALQDVYRGRRSTRRGDQPVQITPEPATNSLLILANQVEMDELTKLIKSLDVEPEAERQRQIKSIKLTYAEPWNVQEAINKLFRAQSRNPRDQVTAVPEYGVRSVIVSASPENMKRVEELIENLDTEEGQQHEVHVINLNNADAESVSRTLTDIFIRSAPRRQGQQAQPITVAALQGSKAVLVKCGAEDFAEIQEVVAELDREDTMVGEEVRVVSLLYSDASEMQTAVQEWLKKPGGRGGRGADLAGDVRISVLSQSNALVISGDKEEVDRLEAKIAELDVAGEKGSVPQIIRLTHASVGQVLPTIQDMFAEQRGGGRRGQQPAVIMGNEAGNFLIVRASPTDFASIQAVVEQLDTEEQAAGTNFRLIQVATGINVTDLAEKVEQAINEGARARAGKGRGREGANITITPDTRTSSLIVSGDQSLFDETEELAHALVAMGPSGKAVKILSLGKIPADEIERLIAQLKGEESSTKTRSRRGTSRSGSSRTSGSSRRPRG